MVEVVDIRDERSLREWLQGRSREEAIWIATRAAMRVLPWYWDWSVSEGARFSGLSVLPMLRSMLTSSVEIVRSTEKINVAATEADAAAAATDPAPATASFAATHAATIASRAARAARAADRERYIVGGYPASAYAARASAYAARAATRSSAWNATRMDCEHIVSRSMEAPPKLRPQSEDTYDRIWASVKATATGPAWAFWIKWYQDMLDGVQPDWDLLERIALIDNAIWDAGPKAVADAIRDIRNDLLEKATPNAEIIVENSETGRLRIEAASLLGADGLGDIQEKMREAADVFEGQGGANGPYAALEPEIELIRRTAALETPRPIRLYDASRRAARRTRRRVENGECPDGDALVEDFVDQLEETALDLLRLNEDVRDAVTSRARAKIDDKPEEVAENLQPAIEELVEISEGDLAAELPQDVAIAGDPNQTPEARKTALYVIASRITRIYRGAREVLSEAHSISNDLAGLSKNTALIVASSAAIQTAINWLLSLL